jgi:D-alanyl-D-alanine carboxypeptidase
MEGGSGKILLEKNARERRPVASLTKLMTAVIILERGRLGDWVRVGRKAATTPGSALGLRAGQRVLLKDLLTGMLVKSANDAAVAAAEHMYGSEEGFVKAMNEKARSLGLSDTHFRNCHGLDHPDHRSSAYDMALLSRYAMSLPFLADCVRNREVAIWLEEAEGVSRPKVYHNPNQFLGFFLGADGVKTGYTREAGRCLVASAWRGNCRMFAVLLDDQERWRDACELLEYGFSLFRQQRIRDLAPAGRWGPEEGEPGG